MKKLKFFTIITILILLFIPILASAETLSGTLGGGSISNVNYAAWGNPTGGGKLKGIVIRYPSQITNTVTAIIMFPSGAVCTGDANMPSGAQQSITLHRTSATGALVGTAVVGYQILFNNAVPPTQTSCYQYILIDPPLQLGGLSEDDPANHYTTLYFGNEYGASGLFNLSVSSGTNLIAQMPLGSAVIETVAGRLYGAYTNNLDSTMYGIYSVTKPSGIGIAGSISKYVNSINYSSRGFLFDANGQVIANEGLANTNTWNFTTNSSLIKLGIYGNGMFYNTSVLFGGAVPPFNPYYTGFMNMTFYIKNAVNNTNIPNAYIDYHYNPALSGNPSAQGYTDVNGAITFQLVDIANNQKVDVYKPGYQHATDTFTPTGQSEMFKIIPMYTDVPGGNPSTPATINITMRVKDVNGNTPISGAYVSVRDTIVGTSERSQTTNSSGYVYFPNFPNTAYIDGVITKSNYLQYHWFADGLASEPNIYLERYLTPSNIVTIPTTIPPAQYDTWALGATPNAIILGSSSSLLLACSNATKQTYPTLQTVLFYENTNLGAYTQPTLVGAYHYNTSATKWNFQFKNGTWDYTTAGYTPLSLSVTPGTTGTYTYSATAIGAGNWPYTTGTTLGSAQTNLLISGPGTSGTLTMSLAARDGSSGAHLQNYTLTLTDRITNQVVTYNVDYDININLPRGSPFTLAGAKENYISGSINFNVPIDPAIVKGSFGALVYVNLFPPGTISAGNTTVAVHVSDQETYYPVPNVQISMSNILDPKFTTQDGGSVSFILPQNTVFVATAHKEGYCDVSESKNTTNKDYMYVDMYIKYGACSAPIPTHTQIPGANGTPTVTPTLIGGYGQQNGTPAVCNQLPVNATLVDQLRNQLACNGLKDVASQNLGLAVGIILLCGMIAASKAKGIGFAIGAAVGTVASMALGLIAFWIVVVIIIIIIGIMVLLAARSGGG